MHYVLKIFVFLIIVFRGDVLLDNQSLSNKPEDTSRAEFHKEESLENKTDKMLYPSLEDMKVDQLARVSCNLLLFLLPSFYHGFKP